LEYKKTYYFFDWLYTFSKYNYRYKNVIKQYENNLSLLPERKIKRFLNNDVPPLQFINLMGTWSCTQEGRDYWKDLDYEWRNFLNIIYFNYLEKIGEEHNSDKRIEILKNLAKLKSSNISISIRKKIKLNINFEGD
jgi:hypothetical protein